MSNISEMRDELDYLENLGYDGILAERQILKAKADRLDDVVAAIEDAVKRAEYQKQRSCGDANFGATVAHNERMITIQNFLKIAKGEIEVSDGSETH